MRKNTGRLELEIGGVEVPKAARKMTAREVQKEFAALARSGRTRKGWKLPDSSWSNPDVVRVGLKGGISGEMDVDMLASCAESNQGFRIAVANLLNSPDVLRQLETQFPKRKKRKARSKVRRRKASRKTMRRRVVKRSKRGTGKVRR